MIRPVEDLRPKYAARMREMAQMIEQSEKQPIGVFVQIFFAHGEMVRAQTLEDGFHYMNALAAFELQKHDLANMLLANQKIASQT